LGDAPQKCGQDVGQDGILPCNDHCCTTIAVQAVQYRPWFCAIPLTSSYLTDGLFYGIISLAVTEVTALRSLSLTQEVMPMDYSSMCNPMTQHHLECVC